MFRFVNTNTNLPNLAFEQRLEIFLRKVYTPATKNCTSLLLNSSVDSKYILAHSVQCCFISTFVSSLDQYTQIISPRPQPQLPKQKVLRLRNINQILTSHKTTQAGRKVQVIVCVAATRVVKVLRKPDTNHQDHHQSQKWGKSQSNTTLAKVKVIYNKTLMLCWLYFLQE